MVETSRKVQYNSLVFCSEPKRAEAGMKIIQKELRSLYPSWDAQNMNSVHLAEKLGYEFDHEYTAYEVS